VIRIASAPPSANAIVSAAGKNIPVLTSPVVVIAGRDTVPAVNSTCSLLLIVIAVASALSSIPVELNVVRG
jgi:hypothetical protein